MTLSEKAKLADQLFHELREMFETRFVHLSDVRYPAVYNRQSQAIVEDHVVAARCLCSAINTMEFLALTLSKFAIKEGCCRQCETNLVKDPDDLCSECQVGAAEGRSA